MPVRGFSHYNLRAPNPLLEELRSFYCEVVGLAVGPRPPFPSFGYWLYAGEHAVLHLSVCAPGEARVGEASSTFDHAAFSCTGRAEYERLLSQRGIDYALASVPQSNQVQLFFSDPAGNGIELNFETPDA